MELVKGTAGHSKRHARILTRHWFDFTELCKHNYKFTGTLVQEEKFSCFWMNASKDFSASLSCFGELNIYSDCSITDFTADLFRDLSSRCDTTGEQETR